jgi:arylsulfatase A-like enzyme
VLIEQAGVLSLREGSWKYIEPSHRPKVARETNTELGNDTVDQLYDLSSDPGETQNLAARQPDRVARMKAELRRIRDRQ